MRWLFLPKQQFWGAIKEGRQSCRAKWYVQDEDGDEDEDGAEDEDEDVEMWKCGNVEMEI